ncbi:MAG: phosphopantothenate--cysteine ligase [Firmicutes bacterium]|nr:phosphopantothenate--cysteine ligase [Bacillota bacterium]
MKKVLITAGGTTESIDTVRGITNFSKGKLGAKIANEFAMCGEISKIYFLGARSTAKPVESDKIEIVQYSDAASLQRLSYEILGDEEIDSIIHSAAISDYTIEEVLGPDGQQLDRVGKISSSLPSMTLKLVQTPKVISGFKAISPDTSLIGFKLLSRATYDELFAAAEKTLNESGCSAVLANRLEDIADEQHKAFLRDKSGTIAEFQTKTEIAKGLADYLGYERGGKQ